MVKKFINLAYKEYIKRSILLGYTGQARDGLSLMKKHKGNISSGLQNIFLLRLTQSQKRHINYLRGKKILIRLENC